MAAIATELPTASFLKWAGGKRRQVPRLRELFEPHRDRGLEEWFCGACNVAFGLQPKRALLNDINPHLINCLRWVKSPQGFGVKNPQGFKSEMLVQWANDRDCFESNKRQFNALIREGLADTEDAAQLFYYLNRTAFNGLCRFNSDGYFNVSFGKYRKALFLLGEDWLPYREAMSAWEFRCGDFRDIPSDPDAFVYADPPFDGCLEQDLQISLLGEDGWDGANPAFVGYSADGFSAQDQLELARMLAERPGPTVLHNRATPRIVHLYEKLGFDLEFVDAHRSISCKGNGRKPVKEVIAKKNL